MQIELTRDEAMQILIALTYRIETMQDYENDANLLKIKNAALSAYKIVERAI